MLVGAWLFVRDATPMPATGGPLLKSDLGKAAQLARMQPLRFLVFEPLQRLQADLKMLTDALAVEFAGHPGELDFAVKRLVRDAEQGAIGNAETITVGSDGCRLHVQRDRAR